MRRLITSYFPFGLTSIPAILMMAITAATPVTAAPLIQLNPIGVYKAANNMSGVFDDNAAEIVAHDPATQRLFIANGSNADVDGTNPSIDVVDISNPSNPKLQFFIDVTPFGKIPQSVAVHNSVIAASLAGKMPQDPGLAVFYDRHGRLLKTIPVGAGPDMITFTPDGNWVVVANEGEPSETYEKDPEGSVSVIDIRAGIDNASIRTAGFTAFNNASLDTSIRIFGINAFGRKATVAEDLEPEFIAVSDDSQTAWVTLQENNALAIVDIPGARVTALVGLGFKDHNLPGNGLDASDKDGRINITSWPVKGMYQPDGIAAYRVKGQTFLITANEGDFRKARERNGSTVFLEDKRVGDEDFILDPSVFPNFETLKLEDMLGRLKVTNTVGNPDNDSEFEELFSFGARSFAIWTGQGSQVFESGDDLEQITARVFPNEFNSDHKENNSFDDRSDNQGPAPEGVTLGEVSGNTYAFIGLTRIGGIMVYDVSNPRNPSFVQYINTRDFTGIPEQDSAGDLSPEGITFITAQDSPIDKPLLVVGHEISGTTRIFEVDTTVDFGLSVSASATRSDSVPLENEELSNDAFIFLTPEFPDADITQVDYFLDGAFTKTETDAPYDLRGTGSRLRALPLSTDRLKNGPHTVRAEIELASGEQISKSARFSAFNADDGDKDKDKDSDKDDDGD